MRTETVKSMIRPIITLSLVWAFIGACFWNPEAIDKLETLTTATVAFWFGGRLSKGEPSNG